MKDLKQHQKLAMLLKNDYGIEAKAKKNDITKEPVIMVNSIEQANELFSVYGKDGFQFMSEL
jgi:hypothetical protein